MNFIKKIFKNTSSDNINDDSVNFNIKKNIDYSYYTIKNIVNIETPRYYFTEDVLNTNYDNISDEDIAKIIFKHLDDKNDKDEKNHIYLNMNH